MPGDVGIWDLAISLQNQKSLTGEDSAARQKEASLVFLGSKGVGKTTLIHRFLEREEAPKQTLALEYTFGRKTNQNLVKDVCHIWELGGGALYTNLVETPLSPEKLLTTAVVLVVDLARPERLWAAVTELVSSLAEYIGAALRTERARGLGLEERLACEAAARVGEDHGDRPNIRPFPVPLLILGGQYDKFQDFEPEKKKIICRSLRFLAHLNGASLQFSSCRDPGLVKRARDLLSHHGFGSPAGQGLAQDYNKPLIIPAGSDSFQAILGPGGAAEAPRLEVVRHQLETHFPQEEEGGGSVAGREDPARDPAFREPEVDMLRGQKDEDLARYRRDADIRLRSWGDEDGV